jgi:DNA-binding LacI/PurR family transcriptional regulator
MQLGCKKIGFLGYHGAASTIAARVAGSHNALAAHGLQPPMDPGMQVDFDKQQSISWSGQPRLNSMEAFLCVNDRIAGQLMHVFLARHVRIPEDIRLVGIDDVSYANLSPVPLTTIRQPTREIGEAALRTILDRYGCRTCPLEKFCWMAT